jgi:thiosulfate/3-mercaptopyruvate sulfurtransferase
VSRIVKSMGKRSYALIGAAAFVVTAQLVMGSHVTAKEQYCKVSLGLSSLAIAQPVSPVEFSDNARPASLLVRRCEEFSGNGPGNENPWNESQIAPPEDLAKQLSSDKPPIILQVGIQPLYKISHIPGAIYAGPASDAPGLDRLKKEAQALPRNTDLVLYCGCCPFNDCPNVKPAFVALQAMGFTRLRVLMLPNNFTQDWVNKGYPADKHER